MALQRFTPGQKAVVPWDEWEIASAKPSRRPFRWMLRLTVLAVVVWTAEALVILVLPSGDWDSAHRFPPPGPDPGDGFAAVAGKYHQGGSRGRLWDLSILPDGRYSFVWSGCGGVYHRESGCVNRVGGYVVLSSLRPIKPRIARVFLPLKWGRRSYLIPAEKLRQFCDAIVQGEEPRNEAAGHFYLLGLDDRVTGIPELPERWATYVRENLVIGTIVEVTEGGRARIDVGSGDGIRIGGILTVQGHDRLVGGQLKVISVNRSSCEVEEVYPGAFDKPVEAGWKVVTARETGARPSP